MYGTASKFASILRQVYELIIITLEILIYNFYCNYHNKWQIMASSSTHKTYHDGMFHDNIAKSNSKIQLLSQS